MIFQWLSGFLTFALKMKQLYLFIFFRFLSISSQLMLVTERLYLIDDTCVKSIENLEHQYWLDQSWPIREKICIVRYARFHSVNSNIVSLKITMTRFHFQSRSFFTDSVLCGFKLILTLTYLLCNKTITVFYIGQ
jgi:hypothetical protein